MSEPDNGPRWQVSVDGRDILGVAGGTCVLLGAAAFHWAAALVVIGVGLCALSYRLSR